jgi:hypothetical protein
MKNYIHLALMAFIVLLIGSIQLLYWKYSTGHWLYNSYKETGQSFDFRHPYLLKGIFSLKKGWLVYSPIMILSFLGFPFLYKNARQVSLPIVTYMLINIYVVFSWCQWDYGGGFGSRPLVQSYAVIILSMGFAIQFLFSKPGLKYLTVLFISGCSVLNLMQTIQYAKGLLSPGGLNSYSYRLLFGKLSINTDDLKSFQKLDKIEGVILSVDTISAHVQGEGRSSFLMTSPILLPGNDSLIYTGELRSGDVSYLRLTAKGRFDAISYNYKELPAIKLSYTDETHRKISERIVKIEPLINRLDKQLNVDYLGDPNVWCPFDFVLKTPPKARYLSISIVNHSGNNTMVDSLMIEQIHIK